VKLNQDLKYVLFIIGSIFGALLFFWAFFWFVEILPWPSGVGGPDDSDRLRQQVDDLQRQITERSSR
jgi:hypothetical protein